jgi:hypothetical protein
LIFDPDSCYPQHNRQSFFKYTSASTALKILESSTVIYRSPIEFNDPFDVQSGLHSDFDINAAPDKILDRIDELVSSQDRPNFAAADNPFAQAILMMWDKKATHGFPRQSLRALLRPELALAMQQLDASRAQYQSTWQQDFLPRLRIFSVSEEKGSLLMWSHYAKDHTGVVIEFRVLPTADNPLCVAKPVQYRRKPLPALTEKQLIDGLVFGNDLDPSDFVNYACIKSDIWEYEKEWRVWDLLSRREPQLHSYYPVARDEIAAIYLGCKMSSELRSSIIKLLPAHPNAKVFQATKAVDEYRLDFIPI